MAVKGSATVTLTQYRDIQSVTRYYKLRPAGSSAPLKPETKPPSSDWTDSEPACDISKELYFCDLTIFSNGQWEYSKVSKSSSYEAAKEAFNRAQAAKDSIDNLEIGGRNLIINRDCVPYSDYNNYNLTNDGFESTGGKVFPMFPTVFEYGENYVLHFDMDCNGSTMLRVREFSECPSEWGDGKVLATTLNVWINDVKHYEYNITPVDSNCKFSLVTFWMSSGTYVKISNLKLEKGNKATDWTPAPEDVDAGIASAHTAADTAESKAEAINSKGEQLVINGNAILGNNTNFTQWLYDGSMANGSGGSFTLSPGIRKYIFNNEFFGLDLSKDYRFEFDAISKDSTSKHYSMLLFYDIDKKEITPLYHMYISEVTELAADLKDGDTVVYLNDISSFKTNTGTATYMRGFIFWNYTNSFGYTYPPKTYSRNTFYNLWDDSGVNKADNTITLKSPWSKGTVPAGTKLSQCSSGNTYKYQPFYNSVVPSEWTHYSCVYSGTDYSGTNILSKFPPGTAYCKVGFIWNDNSSSTDQLWITNVSVYEDYKTGIANVQTGVDSLNDSVYGIQTFEYILDGVTIPVHKREDGTYYYILNDAEVTVAESDLVHDADGDLVSYQEGGIYEDLDVIAGDIDAIDKKVDGFDARADALHSEIQDNSLIARKNARVVGDSLIITNDTATGDVANLLNYLQLNPASIVIYGNGKDIVTIAKTNQDSGYMEMRGTSLFIAQESRLSTVRLRSAEKNGKLALVAGSDGHVSLKEVLG